MAEIDINKRLILVFVAGDRDRDRYTFNYERANFYLNSYFGEKYKNIEEEKSKLINIDPNSKERYEQMIKIYQMEIDSAIDKEWVLYNFFNDLTAFKDITVDPVSKPIEMDPVEMSKRMSSLVGSASINANGECEYSFNIDSLKYTIDLKFKSDDEKYSREKIVLNSLEIGKDRDNDKYDLEILKQRKVMLEVGLMVHRKKLDLLLDFLYDITTYNKIVVTGDEISHLLMGV